MIAIIDLGIGNVKSVKNALDFLKIPSKIISSDSNLDIFDGLILPGVGSFGNGHDSLNKNFIGKKIVKAVVENQKPILGICLGMQLLAEFSEEFANVKGLSLVQGSSYLISSSDKKLKVPNIGWYDVEVKTGSKLFENISNPTFYFLHSYHVILKNLDLAQGNIKYGTKQILAAFSHKNIYGVQFHPEKSQEAGLTLLKNFYNIVESLK